MNLVVTQPKNKSRVLDLYEGEGKHVKAMSIEELRATERYGNCSDEELTNMIDTVRAFTEIVYSTWAREVQDSEQKATTISLQHQQRKAA